MKYLKIKKMNNEKIEKTGKKDENNKTTKKYQTNTIRFATFNSNNIS